jgi:hypothetical protein
LNDHQIMTTLEVRHKIDEYIDCLSPEKLRVAVDFLAYLAERESQEATDELLWIPKFMNSLEKAEAKVSTDSYRNWRDIRRDV